MARNLTDDACAALADLTALRRLDLSGAAITPRGIDRLPALDEIYLEDCPSEAIDRARERFAANVGTRDLMELWDALDDYRDI